MIGNVPVEIVIAKAEYSKKGEISEKMRDDEIPVIPCLKRCSDDEIIEIIEMRKTQKEWQIK